MSTDEKYFTSDFERIFGRHYLTETHSLGYGDWLGKVFRSEIIQVEVRHKGMTGSGYQSECHDNVCALVQVYGGHRVGGFIVSDDTHIGDERCLELVYHSIWLTPEGQLVDVTANNFTDESHVNFMPVVVDELVSVQFDDVYIQSRGVLASIQRDDKQSSDFAKKHHFKTIGLSDPLDAANILKVLALIPFEKFELSMISDDLSSQETQIALREEVFELGGFRDPSSATGRKFDEIVSLRLRGQNSGSVR